jgi:glycerophosphoryl diester phosphodiesterase
MKNLFLSTLFPLLVALAAPEPSGFLLNGVTAHRGNSGEYPENTLPAFESALALGADWIEIDVYLTKDRQLAVTHDKDTGRVGDKKLVIADSTYAELQAVDVATRFRTLKKRTLAECPPARIPLLADVLKLVMRQARTRVSIQPKCECVQEAFRIIRELGAENWVGFNDGSLNTLRQVKTQSKAIPVFWDRNADTDIDADIRTAREEGFESLVVHHNGLTKEKVGKIHKAGLEVGVWTVNDETALKHVLSIGVERVYTDYPARLLSLTQTPTPRQL